MSASNSSKTVISIGDLVTDIVAAIPHFPVEAEHHQLASSLKAEPGGAGNFLVAGARLGMQMLAMGAVGDDAFGRMILSSLEREKIETQDVLQLPGTTTTTVIVLVDEAGEHVYLGKYGEGPVVAMPPAWMRSIETSQAVFSYGYTLQDHRMAPSCQQAIQYAADQGVLVFFDPGPEMARTTQAQKDFILTTSDVLLLTEDEIPIMAGGRTGMDAGRSLLDGGARAVCIKRGPKGCVMFTRERTYEHPGYPVTVRDTTAAGDSFAAAFIYAWLSEWEPEKILAFANAMGAAKVRKVGSGLQVPAAAEVQAVLDEYHIEIKL